MTGVDLQCEIEAKIAKNASRVYRRLSNGSLVEDSAGTPVARLFIADDAFAISGRHGSGAVVSALTMGGDAAKDGECAVISAHECTNAGHRRGRSLPSPQTGSDDFRVPREMHEYAAVSLYPGVTALLARVVLGERLRWVQRADLGLAAVGVLLIAV